MYFNAIAKVISDRTGCDVSAVKPENTFTELGIDSLDTVELLMNLVWRSRWGIRPLRLWTIWTS